MKDWNQAPEPKIGTLLYLNEQLKNELLANLKSDTEIINAAGIIIKSMFPGIILDDSYLWAVIESTDAREFAINKARSVKSSEYGLPCGYHKKHDEVTKDERNNRRMVDAFVRKEAAPLLNFTELVKTHGTRLQNYLKARAIVFDRTTGAVSIADNAPELITAFCSVSIENEKEQQFIKGLNGAKAAVNNLSECYNIIASVVADKEDKTSLSAYPQYLQKKIQISAGMRGKAFDLFATDTPWRSLISYMVKARTNYKPRYFNSVGHPGNIGIEFVFKATGYLPLANAQLRARYPELYKDIPFRGENVAITSMYPHDTPEALEQFKRDLRNGLVSPLKTYPSDN